MDAPVKPGDLLAGKYRVERVLGEGGIGIVVAAQHLALDQLVALKFIRTATLGTPQVFERFHREARAAAKLKSDHVARVIDVGTLEGSGVPYIVMEYLEGEDLSMVTQSRPLPIPEAVAYVLQACEAMAEAHAAGIVHRDLKPANLFRTRAPDGSAHIKVLDFGIAKMTAPTTGADAGLTHTSALMGSPLYMSPEQLESARDVDERADLWALGAILFELITGRPPFVEDSLPRLCVSILEHDVLAPSQFAPHVPPQLDAVILRCLRKNRDERFSNVSELASALQPFAPAHALDSIRRILSTSRPESTQPGTPIDRSREEDAEAPTARGPSHPGLAPTLSMPDLAGTGPSEPRAWSRAEASGPPGERSPTHSPTKSRANVWLGAVVLLALSGIALGAFLVSRHGEAVAVPSASAALPAAPPSAPASSPSPPPATTSALLAEPTPPVASSTPTRVPTQPLRPPPSTKKPGSKTGILSNDRE